jgi:phosphoenolpyruvate-protein phosphotransferase
MSISLRGVGGAPGIAIGRTIRFLAPSPWQPPEADPDAVLARFSTAQAAAAEQLRSLAVQLRAEGHEKEAGIFDAQSLLAEDPFLSDEVARRVRAGPQALEPAILATVADMRAALDALDDPYLRDRALDLDAVGRAVLAALRGESRDLRAVPSGAIILAEDLAPADVMALRGGPAAGFAIAEGGPTSHTLILARALGIPAVVGLGAAMLTVRDGAAVILDGDSGVVVLEADATERASYERRVAGQGAVVARRRALRDEPGRLADGRAVALMANIAGPDEARTALEYGAEGVGLFRTEFLFIDRDAPPGEEEQYAAYRETLAIMGGRTVVARTLDAGGDKPLPYLGLGYEPNPALGLRGLRLCMRRPDLFSTQLRALLRAARHGDLLIMLPMVATPEDLAWGRMAVRAAAESLAREGVPHRADVPVGVMIETPAAAVTADWLARDAAFFSIGSNDLAQYTLAADRSTAELMARYPHSLPAVLRLVAQSARAAKRAGIPCGLCGELAAAPETAAVLVGLGVAGLSMAPQAIPAVKEHLRDVSLAQARALAKRALGE